MAGGRVKGARGTTRKRASAPKVRTGCTTCKIRHLKCDEGRPVCQRCLNDNRRCDGYDQGQGAKKKKAFRIVPFVIQGAKAASSPCTSPALPRAVAIEDTVDDALYGHAQECITRGFEMTDTKGFWQKVVLPLSHTHRPIKYALCALGGAYRVFMVRDLAGDAGYSSPSCAMDMEYQAIQKYNEAIAHIKPVMAVTSMSNIQTTLICCAIFICIENMRGRYADSLRHVSAGCQLLNTYLRETDQGRDSLHGNDRFDPQVFETLIDMFYWLGTNISSYHGDFFFRGLKSQPRLSGIGDARIPFRSFEEAEQCLMDLDRMHSTVFFKVKTLENAGTEEGRFNLPELARCDTEALNLTKSTFETWVSRFELFRSSYEDIHLSPQDHRRMLLLSLNQAMWTVFIRKRLTQEDYRSEDCHAILDIVETLLSMDDTHGRPLFSFNGDLVSSISIICAFCNDDSVMARAITLLRSMRRTEGIWDSKIIARLCETARCAIKGGVLAWETFPRSVPQLAAEISRLGLQVASS